MVFSIGQKGTECEIAETGAAYVDPPVHPVPWNGPNLQPVHAELMGNDGTDEFDDMIPIMVTAPCVIL